MKEIESNSSFELTKSEWDGIFSDGSINPSWVHVMANGISKVNCYLALLSKGTGKRNQIQRKYCQLYSEQMAIVLLVLVPFKSDFQ